MGFPQEEFLINNVRSKMQNSKVKGSGFKKRSKESSMRTIE